MGIRDADSGLATNTVNTVFIDKHCCSSVLMLRFHRLEQSSLICTHCWQFH